MSLDVRDLHRPLDVFSRDNVYLGTILRVLSSADGPRGDAATLHRARPPSPQTSRVNGELLGPMPTAPLGNPGPAAQSAERRYRSDPDGAAPVRGGSIVVGKWWGLVGRRTIPLDQIMSLSSERVVLKQRYDELTSDVAGASRRDAER